MNIAMEDTTEHVDGVLKTTYGDAFIRGNNGMFLFLFVFFFSCICNTINTADRC